MRTFSIALQVRKDGRDLEGAHHAEAVRMSAGDMVVMSLPLKMILPRVGDRNFVSRLKHVVLPPPPLGPISAWMEPRLMDRLTPIHREETLEFLRQILRLENRTIRLAQTLLLRRVTRTPPSKADHSGSDSWFECGRWP